ncbi:MAG: hypothetical protein CVV51_10380 [Spirochaetae bacterium HGW-Spirochaetae-7]|jgi:AcrR family transcriptional regulator|nr:MAG: hypothetical protein CVV51_10380 [Spirochaetae bacterium HGW-Spirochaetae-7]
MITTQQKILDRIARHLFRYGFSSLTMEGAAKYAQVSKRTLYKHFPNKDALLLAAFDFQVGRFAAILASIVNDGTRLGVYKLSTAFAFMAELSQRLPPVLMRDMVQNDRHYWDAVQDFRKKRVYPLFEQLLYDAGKAGLIRGDVDMRLLTGLLLSAVEAIANPMVIYSFPFEPREIIGGLLTMIFKGILSDEGRSGLDVAGTVYHFSELEAFF